MTNFKGGIASNIMKYIITFLLITFTLNAKPLKVKKPITMIMPIETVEKMAQDRDDAIDSGFLVLLDLRNLKKENKELRKRIFLLAQEIKRLRKANKDEPKWIDITGKEKRL